MIITLECYHLLTSNKSRVVHYGSTFNLKLCKMMSEGDKDKKREIFNTKMAVKVNKLYRVKNPTASCKV